MGELPIDYTPVAPETVQKGQIVGPVRFSITKTSHEKSISMLEHSERRKFTKIDLPYLFPSEIWGFARSLSSQYGRINEVAISKASWTIHGTALPGEELTASSTIKNMFSRKKLNFLTAETTTKNESGETLLTCLDELLLLHDVTDPFYQERHKTSSLPTQISYEKERKVYFRYNWDNGKWKNNIHTDAYAQQFGYERGLPEFVMYMDWIFLSQLEQGIAGYDGLNITLKKILPVYEGECITILCEPKGNGQYVHFFRGNQERLLARVSNI